MQLAFAQLQNDCARIEVSLQVGPGPQPGCGGNMTKIFLMSAE